MPITITCPSCRRTIVAPTAAAGRSVRCSCGASVPVVVEFEAMPPPEAIQAPPRVDVDLFDMDHEGIAHRPRRESSGSLLAILLVITVLIGVAIIGGGVFIWNRQTAMNTELLRQGANAKAAEKKSVEQRATNTLVKIVKPKDDTPDIEDTKRIADEERKIEEQRRHEEEKKRARLERERRIGSLSQSDLAMAKMHLKVLKDRGLDGCAQNIIAGAALIDPEYVDGLQATAGKRRIEQAGLQILLPEYFNPRNLDPAMIMRAGSMDRFDFDAAVRELRSIRANGLRPGINVSYSNILCPEYIGKLRAKGK